MKPKTAHIQTLILDCHPSFWARSVRKAARRQGRQTRGPSWTTASWPGGAEPRAPDAEAYGRGEGVGQTEPLRGSSEAERPVGARASDPGLHWGGWQVILSSTWKAGSVVRINHREVPCSCGSSHKLLYIPRFMVGVVAVPLAFLMATSTFCCYCTRAPAGERNLKYL